MIERLQRLPRFSQHRQHYQVWTKQDEHEPISHPSSGLFRLQIQPSPYELKIGGQLDLEGDDDNPQSDYA